MQLNCDLFSGDHGSDSIMRIQHNRYNGLMHTNFFLRVG